MLSLIFLYSPAALLSETWLKRYEGEVACGGFSSVGAAMVLKNENPARPQERLFVFILARRFCQQAMLDTLRLRLGTH